MHQIRMSVLENRLADPARVQPHHYRELLAEGGCAWVAEIDGVVVGFAAADLSRASVWALFVEPGFEGRGIGRGLHRRMMNWFFAAGVEVVWLTTEHGTRAEMFYRDAGWRFIGQQEDGEVRFEMSREEWAGRTDVDSMTLRHRLARCARRVGSACAILAASAAAPAFGQQPAPAPSPGFMASLAEATTALGAGDHAAARAHLKATLRYGPEYPNVLFHLARVEALLGNADGALSVLERLAVQGANRDVGADSAFSALLGTPRFEAVRETIRAAAAPIVASDTAWVLPDIDFIPEGIAYDAGDDVFFVGSLHRHAIVRVAGDGAITPFVEEEGPGWMVGLRVDGPRRVLWAAELTVDSAAPPFARGIGGRASLRAYDLATGALVQSHAAPRADRPQLINDIALLPSGDVYATDSEGNALYRLRAGADRLEQVYGDTTDFTYPNGIAATATGDRLYVAHLEGLSMVVPGGVPVLRRVDSAPGVATSGIDGLYMCGRDLLAVQSLLGFQQVVHLRLDEAGTTVTAARPLERSHPAYRNATTGALAGDSFLYIANAQLDRLGPDGVVSSDGGVPSVVLRLPVTGLCSAGGR